MNNGEIQRRNRFIAAMSVALLAGIFEPTTISAIEFGTESDRFDLSGFVSAGNAFRLTDPGAYNIGVSEVERRSIVEQINKVRLSLYGTHPGDISSQMTVDFLYTSEPDRPFSNRGEIQLDEAYLDFYYRDYDLRVGLQKVIWGKSDLISPFDVLTARDFVDPFVQPTLEDRIAQAGIRVNRAWREYTIEAVFFPIWIRSRVPRAETEDEANLQPTHVDEWFPPMAIYPANGVYINDPEVNLDWMLFLPTYHPMKLPKTNLSTATFGVKANRLFGEYDVDFYLLTTMDPTPTAEVNTELSIRNLEQELGLQGQGLVILVDGQAEFKRTVTFGASGARTWGPVALRSEMAVIAGKQYFRLFDPAAMDEALTELDQYGVGEVQGAPKSHADWVWITGADYEIPNIFVFLSSQLSLTKRFGHEDFYTQAATDVDWTFLVRKSFLDDYLTFSMAGMAAITGGSVWVGPAVSYTPPAYEDIQFGAKLNVFAGNEFSKIGMYGDQSNVVLNLRWLF